MKAWERRVGEGQRGSHHRARRGRDGGTSLRGDGGALCPVWVSPPGIKLLRETLGLLLGESGHRGSGGE